MKFTKTINLWDNDVVAALESGALRLQSGQWVTCGTQADRKSRFHCIKPHGTIVAFHQPKQYEQFIAGQKEADAELTARRAANRAAHLAREAAHHTA